MLSVLQYSHLEARQQTLICVLSILPHAIGRFGNVQKREMLSGPLFSSLSIAHLKKKIGAVVMTAGREGQTDGSANFNLVNNKVIWIDPSSPFLFHI